MSSLTRTPSAALEDLLHRHPLFTDLPVAYVRTLADCATDVHFGTGETVFREGEEANRLYLICEGQVALQAFSLQAGALTIDTLEAGDLFGWSWLVPPHRWRFDARAVRRTHAIALDGARLREQCDKEPALGFELLRRVAALLDKRLQATRQQLLERFSVNA